MRDSLLIFGLILFIINLNLDGVNDDHTTSGYFTRKISQLYSLHSVNLEIQRNDITAEFNFNIEECFDVQF